MGLTFEHNVLAAFHRWRFSLARLPTWHLLSGCKIVRLLSCRRRLNRDSKHARNETEPPKGCIHGRWLRANYLLTLKRTSRRRLCSTKALARRNLQIVIAMFTVIQGSKAIGADPHPGYGVVGHCPGLCEVI